MNHKIIINQIFFLELKYTSLLAVQAGNRYAKISQIIASNSLNPWMESLFFLGGDWLMWKYADFIQLLDEVKSCGERQANKKKTTKMHLSTASPTQCDTNATSSLSPHLDCRSAGAPAAVPTFFCFFPSTAECCLCCCKLCHQHSLIARLHPRHPLPVYLTTTANSTLLRQRLNGSEQKKKKKSIMEPSGPGVRGQWGSWKVCRGKEATRGLVRACVCVCVCSIRSGQQKRCDQRPRGCMCQACHGSNLWPLIHVCACVCRMVTSVCGGLDHGGIWQGWGVII